MSPEPSDERLDELQEHIDEARAQAESDGLLPDSAPERTFADPEGDGVDDPPNNAPA